MSSPSVPRTPTQPSRLGRPGWLGRSGPGWLGRSGPGWAAWSRPAAGAGRRWPGRLLGPGAGLALGLLALGPGLGPGFLLSYDLVFVPREPLSAALPGPAGGAPRAIPSDVVVATLSRVIPADLLEKLILLSIFVLACSGAVALLARQPAPARLAAGVFYAWNPFVAERLLIGQWALLLGYAALPWILRAVTPAAPIKGPPAGRLAVALLPAVVGGFAALAITALVAVPAASARALSARRRGRTEPGPGLTAVCALLAVGCLPWLIPALSHPVYASPAGGTLFAARADTPFGTLGSLIALGGSWNAQTVPPGYGGPRSALWLAAVIVALAGYLWVRPRCGPDPDLDLDLNLGQERHPGPAPGSASGQGHGPARWAAQRPGWWAGQAVAALAGLALASLGLTAAGRDLLRAATGWWPGFAVLRDAQQFVAPLALAEALGFGLAVARATQPRHSLQPAQTLQPLQTQSRQPHQPHDTQSRQPRQPQSRQPHQTGQPLQPGQPHEPRRPRTPDAAGWLAVGLVAVLVPVLLLPGLAWGAAGRLRPVSYPSTWLAAARVINDDRAAGSALVLPWTAYRRPSWNDGRTMLDPWPRLLARPVIWNDGGLVGTVQLAPDGTEARRLDAIIRSRAPLTGVLARAGVRFVIADAGGSVRSRLPGCPVVAAGPGLTVYRVPIEPVPVAQTATRLDLPLSK